MSVQLAPVARLPSPQLRLAPNLAPNPDLLRSRLCGLWERQSQDTLFILRLGLVSIDGCGQGQ